MNDFLTPNHYLSNLFLETYQEEKKQFDDIDIELSKTARDKEYAKVASAALVLLLFLFRKSNKLDEKIIEIYKSNYRLGGTIEDIIPQIRNAVKVFKESKSLPKKNKLRFKNWKLHLELGIEIISMFETCNSDEEIVKELGRLIVMYDLLNKHEATLKKLIDNEASKPFKVEPIMEIENYKNYQKYLNLNSSDEDIIWIYLKALYDSQESVGIYYVLPKELIDNKRINRIIKKMKSFQLAEYEDKEFGNNNVYMRISHKGDYAIENFQSFNQYQNYLEESENKKNSNYTSIINNGANSTIQFGNNNKSSISTNNNTPEIIKKVDEIIEKLFLNTEIESNQKRDAIKTLEKFNDEVKDGEITSNTWTKFLSLGDQISSIGGFINAIVQMVI